jgi:cytochrome P450
VNKPAHVPDQFMMDYDILTPGRSAQEHLDGLARRRASCPVTYSMTPLGIAGPLDADDRGFWLFTTYDDIASVYHQPDLFWNGRIHPDGDIGPFGDSIPLGLDGELHRSWRRLLNPLLSPGFAKALEPSVRQLSNELIDKFIDRGSCEFISEFARPLPGTLFLRMMGWPVEDAEMFQGWVNTVVENTGDTASFERILDAHHQRQAYMLNMIKDRRAHPTDDFTTVLINSTLDGRTISDEELLSLFGLLLIAGLDTVQSVLGQSIVHLAQNPPFRTQMLEPQELPAAIEELLRWAAPAQPERTAATSAEVGGVRVERGDRLYCPIQAANRDPKYFPEPDTPRLDRDNPKAHMTFGIGPHRCLGSHIARVELKAAFEEWHRRIPEYHLAPNGIGPWRVGRLWGLDHVNLEF